MSRNILVIAAHPDDEVLGCGATIGRLTSEGHIVYILILGEGITSRDDKRQPSKRKRELTLLKEQTHKVGKLLGIKQIFMHDLPDNRFDTVPLLDIVKLVENYIRKIRPEIIFTHSNSDLNIDHVITHRAVLTATRPSIKCAVKEIYTFSVPSSTEWGFGEFGFFKPNVFFDIEKTIDIKIKALIIYDSELRQFPHPRSAEAVKSIARRWGSAVNLQYAEAFHLIRSIR